MRLSSLYARPAESAGAEAVNGLTPTIDTIRSQFMDERAPARFERTKLLEVLFRERAGRGEVPIVEAYGKLPAFSQESEAPSRRRGRSPKSSG